MASLLVAQHPLTISRAETKVADNRSYTLYVIALEVMCNWLRFHGTHLFLFCRRHWKRNDAIVSLNRFAPPCPHSTLLYLCHPFLESILYVSVINYCQMPLDSVLFV